MRAKKEERVSALCKIVTLWFDIEVEFYFAYLKGYLLSLILKLFLSCMPYDYILTQSDLANSIMAIALLLIYYTFSLRVIYELKSIKNIGKIINR